MNLKQVMFWKKHRKDSFIKQFFKDVYIEDEQLKEDILEWITRLKNMYIPIEIENFSSLFSKYEEIVFPIKVYGHHPCRLLITDAIGNNHYLWYNPFRAPKYSIGKMTNYIYTEFTYLLSTQSGISLISLHHFEILQLDGHGNFTDNKVRFTYNLDSSITTVELHTKSENTIFNVEIQYEYVDFEHDNKIWKDLLDLCEKSHDENTLLNNMKNILEFKNILTVTSSTLTDLV